MKMIKQALKELRAKASQKGSFGGSGLKKSGKKWSVLSMKCVLKCKFIKWKKQIILCWC